MVPGMKEQVHDVYVDARFAEGRREPAEVRLRWKRRPRDPPSAGALGATLRLEPGGRHVLLAERPDGTTEVLDAADGEAGLSSRATTLSLSYVDGVLRAAVGGWSTRVELPSSPGDASVAVAGAVEAVAIDRDVHYTQQGGAHGTERPYQVNAGNVFCLGDHSFNSTDSRFRDPGEVPIHRIVGRVVWRIWPPTRVGRVR
jgi:hypothetical protein